MSESNRKKRSGSLTITESDNRAQKLNQAADRTLCQQLSRYEKEEKQLQRELLDLRRTRETLDAGFKLFLSPRSCRRRGSEHARGIPSDFPRRNSGCSSQFTSKLPPIVSKSPIPLRRAKSPETISQWANTAISNDVNVGSQNSHDISVKESKTCFLSVPEKVLFRRTHSSPNENSRRKTDENLKSCTPQVLNENDPLHEGFNQEIKIQTEENDKETSLEDDDAAVDADDIIPKTRGRSLSDFSQDSLANLLFPNSFSHGDSGSLLSPTQYVPTAPLSPKPKRGNPYNSQSSKTNVDLMQSTKLSGKFKAVGHVSLGLAVISRLSAKTSTGEQDLDEKVGELGRYSPRRRGTLAHINLIPPPDYSPTDTRRQKTCWTATKEDISQDD